MKPVGQRRRELANQLDGARHRHRDLERADAALGDRVDDGAQLARILHADHGDDAGLARPRATTSAARWGVVVLVMGGELK